MLVMVSNATGNLVDELATRFRGQLGNLVSVGGWRSTVLPQFALDNGEYPAWVKGERARMAPLLRLCDDAEALELEHGERPRFVTVPDAVGDRERTLELWRQHAPWFRAVYQWPLALVVQDRMEVRHVKALAVQPDVIFLGGSSDNRKMRGWKWQSLAGWCKAFPRVHVGRVNNFTGAVRCLEAGAESIDGTGWMCTTRQRLELVRFLEHQKAVTV